MRLKTPFDRDPRACLDGDVRVRRGRRMWIRWLCGLGLSVSFPAFLRAADEPPVCIMDIGGELRAVEGPCPDPLDASAFSRPSSDPVESPRGNPPRGLRPTTKAGITELRLTLSALSVQKDEAAALRSFERLVQRGSAVVDPAVAVLEDSGEDPRTRWVAGRLLGRIRDPAAVDALIRAMKDPVPMVRLAAVRGLIDSRSTRALPVLREALHDKAALVRAASIEALGSLGTREDVPALIEQLDDPANFHRGQALFVRAYAATSLGRLGGREAIRALIPLADDSDEATRTAADAALRGLAGLRSAPPGPGSPSRRWAAYFEMEAREKP